MELNPAEKQRGKLECENDIANGTFHFFWQTRGKWGEFMTEILLERFNVVIVHTSCFTTSDIHSYRRGYNDRMTEYVDAKFGPDSMKNAMDEIQTYRKKIYDESVKKRNLDAKSENTQ